MDKQLPEIYPTRDNILLKKEKLEETRGGIIIPETSGKHVAIVKAVGPDVEVCKVGDEVKVSADEKYRATVMEEDDDYIIGPEAAIIAVVKR